MKNITPKTFDLAILLFAFALGSFLLGTSFPKTVYLPPTLAQISALSSVLPQPVREIPVYLDSDCPVCDCSVDSDLGYHSGYSEGVRAGEEFARMYQVEEKECYGLECTYNIPRR